MPILHSQAVSVVRAVPTWYHNPHTIFLASILFFILRVGELGHGRQEKAFGYIRG